MHATIYTTRTISAAHHLPKHAGKCQGVHGHNFKVEVWIEGAIRDDGMVMDFKEVKDLIDYFDHGDLNDYIGDPTAENLAAQLFKDITIARANTSFVKVRVWESENSYAEVSG